MMAKAASRVVTAGLLFLAAAGDAPAAEQVDLLLVLAVDVSGSVDEEEGQLQRQGYHDAFGDPRVMAAIQQGYQGRIAVTYFEWAGFEYNRVIADWMVIEDEQSAEAFRFLLRQNPPMPARRTSISQAIDFGSSLFGLAEMQSRRKVIDISGDGANNWGRPVESARDEAVGAGITINGLPIVNDRPSGNGRRQEANLDLYYQHCVIGGMGAFIVVAQGFEDFARAVRRKLILEIAGEIPDSAFQIAQADGFPVPPMERAQSRDGRAEVSCMMGERIWRDPDY